MSEEILYRKTTPEDYNIILEFLRKYFYPYEPLTLSCEPKKQDEHDEASVMSYMEKDDNTCLVAFCGDLLVGVVMAVPKRPDEEKRLLEEASHLPGTKWAKLLNFLAALERKANVFEKYNVDKVMHGQIIATHSSFRERKIALKIHEKSMEMARELGYSVYTVDCTSTYSARLSELNGMECISALSFADFRVPGCDGQVLFPPKEHTIVKTYAKRLL